jgi:coenzyme F420-reducing hydrogenase delta subunit
MNIDEILKDYESKHSEYQIENFIVGMQVGDWAKYKQCLREIKNRVETLQGLKEELEIERLKSNGYFNIATSISRRKRRLKEIGRVRKKRALKALDDDIISTEREISKFFEVAKKLKEEIGDLTPEKRDLLEADSWFQKARQMAAIDMICDHGLSKPTFEMILALPEKDKNTILTELGSCKDPRKLLE